MITTTATSANDDAVAAHELALYTINDGELYRQQTLPIINMLAKRKGKGQYDHEKALKAWGYLAEAGAKKYAREHAGPNDAWHKIFPPVVRKLACEEFADHYAEHIDELANG